jgi:MarR family transcriptional regulator, temperature-dependent positive regulator of motility
MGKAAKATVATLERSPSHLLHRALQLALDVYADEAGDIGLTQRQYAVLAAVAANEGLTQTDLVRATGIDRSTLADMIARMIAKGHLARERSATDGRANTVSLTVEGRAILDAAEPKVAAADRRILAHLAANKRDSFLGVLRDLAKAGEKTLLGETDSDAAAKKAKKKAEKAAKPEKAEKAPKADKVEKKKKKKAKDHAKKAS